MRVFVTDPAVKDLCAEIRKRFKAGRGCSCEQIAAYANRLLAPPPVQAEAGELTGGAVYEYIWSHLPGGADPIVYADVAALVKPLLEEIAALRARTAERDALAAAMSSEHADVALSWAAERTHCIEARAERDRLAARLREVEGALADLSNAFVGMATVAEPHSGGTVLHGGVWAAALTVCKRNEPLLTECRNKHLATPARGGDAERAREALRPGGAREGTDG